jgi:chromosome segregation ATPase
MKIKVETLEEVLGEIETEERFEIILPFLKKISELEEEIEEKGLDEAEDVKDLRNMVPQLKDEIEQLKKQNEENLKNASKREDQRFLKFQTERENLLKENDILEKENEKLRNLIDGLKRQIRQIQESKEDIK